MPIVLLWAAPAAIMFSSVGYYLVALATVVDCAIALAAPAAGPPVRRPMLKVIQGGRFRP
jgi:hypothetical protein